MKSKEKARELVSKYYWNVSTSDLDCAIKCAIIAVDEIYIALQITTGHLTLNSLDEIEIHRDFRYWQEVKQHLEEML